MTPERALAILEGKIPRREPPERPMDERKPSMGRPAQPGFTFIKIFSLGSIAAVVVVFYMWRHTLVSSESYQRGFNEGETSMNVNLGLAQKEITTQGQEITRLQQDLGKSNDTVIQWQQQVATARQSLDAANRQDDRLAALLKAAQQSIPVRIRRVKEESRGRIVTLTEELRSAQKALHAKAQSYTAPLQQQITDIQQDLKAALQQREALQRQVDDLERQLGVAQSQVKSSAMGPQPQ